MKLTYFKLTLILSVLLVMPNIAMADATKHNGATQESQNAEALRSEIEHDLLTNILPYWLEKSPDAYGGFNGLIAYNGVANEQAPKGAVLGARILWTFSAAYRNYSIAAHKDYADKIQQFYIQHFIDKRYGGVYWTLNPEGAMLDGTKQTYAAAFGIYGLSEHFRATGNKQSLETAISLYRTLNEKVKDKQNGGYKEVMSRDYSSTVSNGVDDHAGATKTMNTHIHLLEAFTNLYKVWHDKQLENDIRDLIMILSSSDRLYNPQTGHLRLFCNDAWQELDKVDSYGHDIETSWLLYEAAEVLGDKALILTVGKQSVRMVDVALAEGTNPDGSMIYEKNSKGLQRRLSWWPQCESIVGCVNAWQITGKQEYLDQAVKMWQFVRDNFIDRENGEWHHYISASGEVQKKEPKGSLWNCPYHNSRMGFEIVNRLKPQAVHSEVMAWSNITGVRMDGELIDFESTLRVGNPGKPMESTAREAQNNVRYRRDGQTQIVDIPLHGAHFHQEITDVDQSTVKLSWQATADSTLREGAYFCMELAPKYYSAAKIKAVGKKVSVSSAERNLSLEFDKAVKTFVREENGSKVLYVTLLNTLQKGQSASLSAILKTSGTQHHETARISLDMAHPGSRFEGFGGNFRIQDPARDPMVIDYCLDNLRVAFGRVELPWALWDKEGVANERVKASIKMAKRLKRIGMPVVLSCWFPPEWALVSTQRQRPGVAALRLKPEMKDRIYDSLLAYIKFMKDEHGVDVDYFSFNESDIGIDVLHTPQEHCDFIKEFGARLAAEGLACKILLGDNSDATSISFIQPALKDKDAHKYIGAVSFHSWRGCDDETLRGWRDAARSINVPLIVGEGSTDAAAWRYPGIFKESTFALYEINLYTRLCNICQPLSILQWQLTADYSLLYGEGVLSEDGPLRPTQRFFNLKQLAMTPANAFAIPVSVSKDNINAAAMSNTVKGEAAVHIVNNGASCMAEITGLPLSATKATAYITNSIQHAEAQQIAIADGNAEIFMPAESFVTIICEE